MVVAKYVLIIFLAVYCGSVVAAAEEVHYGVDVSFPIHHTLDPKSRYGKEYYTTMKGCHSMYTKRECDLTEESRIEMNLAQPRTQYNYTDMGFLKL